MFAVISHLSGKDCWKTLTGNKCLTLKSDPGVLEAEAYSDVLCAGARCQGQHVRLPT
jgi:hypothetical protein